MVDKTIKKAKESTQKSGGVYRRLITVLVMF